MPTAASTMPATRLMGKITQPLTNPMAPANRATFRARGRFLNGGNMSTRVNLPGRASREANRASDNVIPPRRYA
jgi:hypothetical protein